MCFPIDFNAPTPKNRVAWKVVEISRGRIRSLSFSHLWNPGNHKYSGTLTSVGGKARAGIYAYLEKKDAIALKDTMTEDYPFLGHKYCLMKVKVSPKDFLYKSIEDSAATYSKVVVPREQEDIDLW